MSKKINFPAPDLQIGFALELKKFRSVYLQGALLETVQKLDITHIDKELATFVPKADLATLAKFGLRGELLFPVPTV
ncbi:XcyI family restriction endonuclease, partial [Streptomyces scabiei]